MNPINKRTYIGFGVLLICLSLAYGVFKILQTETYLCKGEIVTTDSSYTHDDEIKKSPIEFGFSWDKKIDKLELSSIGDLGFIANLIARSYRKEGGKEVKIISDGAWSSDKNIGYLYIGEGDLRGEDVFASFDFDRIANYLVMHRSVKYKDSKYRRRDEFNVTAKCSRKWL